MGLIRNAEAGRIARDALVLDLGDLQRQGRSIIADAERRAEAIVREAERKRADLLEDAASTGRAEGLARGLAEGRASGEVAGRAEALEAHAKRIDALEGAWTSALDELENERRRLACESVSDVVRLAATVAERVTRRVVELDPQTAARQLEAVVGMVLRRTSLTVRISPEDRAVVEEALPRVRARLGSECELVEDATLPRGSVVVRQRGVGTDGLTGEIDASIEVELARITEALVAGVGDTGAPGAPAGGPGGSGS